MNDAIRMQLSAFVDGELPENEAELLLRRMSQDAELRHDVAEYLAIGRLIRSETGLSGADRLHQRVAAAIDDHEQPIVDDIVAETVGVSRALRPLVGVTIAASVALVAIFVLQQTNTDGSGELPNDTPDPIAAVAVPVPTIDVQEERQRQYFRSHAEMSSEFGANGMNSRVVSLRFSEDLPQASGDSGAETAENGDTVGSAEETVTSPE